jgi:ATP-dependent Clp protease ATP-binding subunit ClpC
LTEDIVSQILDLEMKDLHARLKAQNLTLELSEDARQFILSKGFDPVNGARPLRRAVERYVTRPLSARIVEDSFEPGAVIRAHAHDGQLRFVAGTTA